MKRFLCDDCSHFIGCQCEYPSSTVDPYDCAYFEEYREEEDGDDDDQM